MSAEPALGLFAGLVRAPAKDTQHDAMVSEGKNSAMNWTTRCRSCQSRQNPHPPPARGRFLQQEFVMFNNERVFFDQWLCSRTRSFYWQRLRFFRAAEFFDRPTSACRLAWQAN